MFTLEEKAVRPQAASIIRGPQVHNTGDCVVGDILGAKAGGCGCSWSVSWDWRCGVPDRTKGSASPPVASEDVSSRA